MGETRSTLKYHSRQNHTCPQPNWIASPTPHPAQLVWTSKLSNKLDVMETTLRLFVDRFSLVLVNPARLWGSCFSTTYNHHHHHTTCTPGQFTAGNHDIWTTCRPGCVFLPLLRACERVGAWMDGCASVLKSKRRPTFVLLPSLNHVVGTGSGQQIAWKSSAWSNFFVPTSAFVLSLCNSWAPEKEVPLT